MVCFVFLRDFTTTCLYDSDILISGQARTQDMVQREEEKKRRIVTERKPSDYDDVTTRIPRGIENSHIKQMRSTQSAVDQSPHPQKKKKNRKVGWYRLLGKKRSSVTIDSELSNWNTISKTRFRNYQSNLPFPRFIVYFFYSKQTFMS